MKLFTNKICPFAQRAWMTAVEKNIDVELVIIPLDQEAPDWYKAINPRETVPALKTADGKIVIESLYVARYLDENFEPRNSLMTNNATTRFVINNFIDFIGSFIGSCYEFVFADADSVASAEKKVTEKVAEIEAKLASLSAGPYVLGNTFSMADIALVPFVDRFRYTLRAIRGYSLLERAPRLDTLVRTAFLRRSVWSTALQELDYVKAYSGENRPVRVAPQWTLTVAAGSPSHRSIAVALQWMSSSIPTNTVVIDAVPQASDVTIRMSNGSTIAGSTVMTVLEFLADQFGVLQADDAFARSVGRTFVNISEFLPSDTAADKQMTAIIQESGGPFMSGKAPTIYDAAALPFIDQTVKDPKLSDTVGSALRALLTAASESPAVAAILNA